MQLENTRGSDEAGLETPKEIVEQLKEANQYQPQTVLCSLPDENPIFG